jgi:hypothetical protein
VPEYALISLPELSYIDMEEKALVTQVVGGFVTDLTLNEKTEPVAKVEEITKVAATALDDGLQLTEVRPVPLFLAQLVVPLVTPTSVGRVKYRTLPVVRGHVTVTVTRILPVPPLVIGLPE